MAVKEGGIPGKKFMQNHIMENRQNIQGRKRAKAPWIVRLFLALGALIRFLAKCLWRFACKNVPLALGMALFAILFAAIAYNAFFRQNMVARPVLFSTRAALPAAQSHNSAQKRPFVEKAISTEALHSGRSGAPAPLASGLAGGGREQRAASGLAGGGREQKTAPKRALESPDAIADFIAAQEKTAIPGAMRQKPQSRPQSRAKKPVAHPDAKPRLKSAAP